MSKACTVAVDAGGTNIKSCLILNGGEVVEGTMLKMAAHSNENSEKIFSAQIRTIQEQLTASKKLDLNVTGIALGFPGPFDYSTGTCLMKHKYTAIYKLPILPELINNIDLPENCKIKFFSDLHTFTFGEYLYGAGRECGSLLGVCIGTGLATGLVMNNRIIHNGKGGPAYPIFQEPYKGGILEDRVSARGIVNHYCMLKGFGVKEALDPQQIAGLAVQQKDPDAIDTYSGMGAVLGQYLKPIIESLGVESVVLGGQISKAYALFGPQLENELQDCNSLHGVSASRNLEYAALKGAAALLSVDLD